MSTSPIQQLGADTIEVFIGQSKTWQIALKKDPGGGPLDLTGTTLYFTVRRVLSDTTPKISKTSDVITEIEILSPEIDGLAKVLLSPSDTNNLEAGDYVYDMWVKLASLKVYPIIDPSPFIIKTPVTQVTP